MTDPTKDLTPEAREKVAVFQRSDLRDFRANSQFVMDLNGFDECLIVLKAILNEKDAEIQREKKRADDNYDVAQEKYKEKDAELAEVWRHAEDDRQMREHAEVKIERLRVQYGETMSNCVDRRRERDEAVALLRDMAQRAGNLWRGTEREMLDAESSDADLADVELGELLTKTDALIARIDGADEGHALVETMGHIDGMDDESEVNHGQEDSTAPQDAALHHNNDSPGAGAVGDSNTNRRIGGDANAEPRGTTEGLPDVTEGAGEKPDPARPEADPVAADASADSPAPDLALPIRTEFVPASDSTVECWALLDLNGVLHDTDFAEVYDKAHADAIVEAVNGWYVGHGTPEGELAATQAVVEGLSDENARLWQRVEALEQAEKDNEAMLKTIAELGAERDALQENIDPLRDGFNQSQAVVRRLRTALEEVLHIGSALAWNLSYDPDVRGKGTRICNIIDAALTKEEDDGKLEKGTDDNLRHSVCGDGRPVALRSRVPTGGQGDAGPDSAVGDGFAEVTPFAPRKTDEPFMLERPEYRRIVRDGTTGEVPLSGAAINAIDINITRLYGVAHDSAARIEAEVEALWRALAGDEWEDHRAEWLGRNG